MANINQNIRRICTDEEKTELLAKFAQYIDNEKEPLIQEFAYLNDITKHNIYYWAEKEQREQGRERLPSLSWSLLLKKCTAKSEVYNIRQVNKQGVSPGGHIFKLKSMHGHRDNHGQEQQPVNVNITVPDIAKKSDDDLENIQKQLLDDITKAQKAGNKRKGN